MKNPLKLTDDQIAFVMKWIEALESGQYKQGKNFLCQIDDTLGNKKYCCLGVACEISGVDQTIVDGEVEYLGQRGLLPMKVSKMIGSGSLYGFTLTIRGYRLDMTQLNDGECQATFLEIATALREQVIGQ